MSSARVLVGVTVVLMFAWAANAVGQVEVEDNGVIIQFASAVTPEDVALVEAAGGTVFTAWTLVQAMHAHLPVGAREVLLAGDPLADESRVVSITRNQFGTPTDEYDDTWGVERINTRAVHLAGHTGAPRVAGREGIRVAIIDTGCNIEHVDLAHSIVFAYDFDQMNEDVTDLSGHGTHIAGTIAAALDGRGVVGVAPEVGLCILQVGVFGMWESAVISALQWVRDNDIEITNNSFSFEDPSAAFALAFSLTEANGTLNVAGSGNGGTDVVDIPARYSSVVAVGATHDRDRRASFSQGGPLLELVAPGVDILSCMWDEDVGRTPEDHSLYELRDGTSMAAPHVAGVAALVFAAGIQDANRNGRVNDEVRDRLNATAMDLGAPGRDDDHGFGMVDARAALGVLCKADLDDDGELTIFDFLAFQNLFDAGSRVADFDGDFQLTIFDFLAFQNAFDAGCV